MDSKEDKLYTLWLFNIAMENGPFKDGLPIKNGDFPWQTVSHNQMFIILQTSWGWIKDDQRPMIHTSPLTG